MAMTPMGMTITTIPGGGLDGYMGAPPYTGMPAQQGYADQQYGQDQYGNGPHSSDLYQ